MNTINLILIIVLGLIVGSFLNVLILRMDDLKSVLYTRSHCPSCQKTLAWYDLVPFLSFVLLRGKCRYCLKPISWQYPVVELLTAVVFLLLYLYFGLSIALLFYIIEFSILIVILIFDIRTQTVPEYFSWVALGLAFLGGWYFGGFSIFSGILGALISGGLLAILVYASKEKWMGAGDIKIGATLGFLCGYPAVLVGTFLAFVLGSIVGIIYIYLTKQTIKSSLPFAPFLVIATLITILFGRLIIDWYTGSFFLI